MTGMTDNKRRADVKGPWWCGALSRSGRRLQGKALLVVALKKGFENRYHSNDDLTTIFGGVFAQRRRSAGTARAQRQLLRCLSWERP